jgi:hypothetical protein
MNKNEACEEYELQLEDIEAMKTFAKLALRDEDQVVSFYKAQRRRGLSHLEAQELISFVSGPVTKYSEISIDDCIECYWTARGFGETHFRAMHLMYNVAVADLQVLFDNWSHYVVLKSKGLTDKQAQEFIVILAGCVEVSMREKVDLYWRVRQLDDEHGIALCVMIDAHLYWGNVTVGLSKYFGARTRGLSFLEASGMMKIAARYTDMPMEDLIECYSRLRGLGTSCDDAIYLMLNTNIRDPKLFDLWPYYLEQRNKGLSCYDAWDLVFRVPTFVDAPMENIIEFYWRLRQVVKFPYNARDFITTDNVTDPDFFDLWPYYLEQEARGLTWVEARQLIKKAASLTRVSIEDCVEFYWRVRQIGASHNDALALMKEDNVADPDFFDLWPFIR